MTVPKEVPISTVMTWPVEVGMPTGCTQRVVNAVKTGLFHLVVVWFLTKLTKNFCRKQKIAQTLTKIDGQGELENLTRRHPYFLLAVRAPRPFQNLSFFGELGFSMNQEFLACASEIFFSCFSISTFLEVFSTLKLVMAHVVYRISLNSTVALFTALGVRSFNAYKHNTQNQS